jgi:heme-degrading monooxygenase HmoA
MVRFESLEALRGWREHPDHLVAQRRGKSEFYASYRIEVCEVVRAYDEAAGAHTVDRLGRALQLGPM